MCTLLRHSEAERAEFDMTLALLDDEPAAYTPPDWVDVRQINARFSLPKSIVQAGKVFADVKPDVSISFLTRANLSNVLNSGGRPCIISERANTAAHLGNGPRGAVSKAMIRMIYPRATKVIAVSEGVAEGLRDRFGVPAGKLVTIANPVDIEVIEAKANEPAAFTLDEPYILAAGRMVPSKGFEMLIRAYAASGIAPKLVIAGHGELRADLEQLVRSCGLEGRVLMPGFMTNLYPVMRNAQMYVLCSSSEGFPNALVESMALGLPVIATNAASGPSEILAEAPRASIKDLTFAPHGVLTPVGSVERMTEALRAMQDPERRRSYGIKAAERARAFGASISKDRYWDVIREALQSGVGQRRA
jgi:N-acetylgalactosamine-N,N'-diacetylbacillosaminyl-diphospho-undecaprenol 4-alpha-N-acetylgalactosaminyltransferase